MSTELAEHVESPVFTPGEEGYEGSAIGHNLAAVPVAEVVVAARSTADVIEAVRWAGANGKRVAVLATGHGPVPPPAEVLVNTSAMDDVSIDPGTKLATIGAGVQWEKVVQAAAEHGLAAVTGSSTNVGVVGYLLGGGLGPLIRSHGFSSDYVDSFEVVTGEGELVTASAGENPDLFWALRGGKAGLGVVTSVRVRLVELPELYAGSLFFAEEDIDAALRGWIAWLPGSDERVTTSIAIVQFPPFDEVPPPLRGRRLLSVRFAFPGPSAEGEALAAPLRDLAPVYIDDIGAMAATEMARISNDPTEPGPSWISARLLGELDDGFASELLGFAGAGTAAPFVAIEVRRLGGAGARDVEGGSAASGRGALHSIGMVGVDPSQFESGLPEAAAGFYGRIEGYLSSEGNPNFSAAPKSLADFEGAFQPDVRARLAEIRDRYDPAGVIALWK